MPIGSRLVALCLALLSASAQAAEAPPPDLRPLALRLVRQAVHPAYAAFRAEGDRNAIVWETECRTPHPARDHLAAAYRALAQAWWTIEAIRFGPVGEDFRAERLNFWPDRRNATTRGLAAMRDPAAPAPTTETVRAQSAAAQGLPALERLVFEGKGDMAPRDCALGTAIAANVDQMARDIEAGWSEIEQKAASDPDFARELSTRILTDVLGEFQVLIDAKLAALGKTLETARPDGLEGRRAGLEREALARPIASITGIARVLVDGRREGETALATLESALSIAEGLPPSLGPLLADPRRRSQVVLLRDALRSAQETALSDLPSLVGVTVGFNSRDGD
jgi:uncharacterized protein